MGGTKMDEVVVDAACALTLADLDNLTGNVSYNHD